MITQARLKELLDYDAETGVFRWKKPTHPRIKVGQICGCRHPSGRIVTILDRRNYALHRLAWLYVHGFYPPEQIDHINGDPSDNRLSNLRLANKNENMWNRGPQRKSQTGYKGVFRVSNGYIVRIRKNGARHYVGFFKSPEKAAVAYQEAAKQLHGEFAKW